MPLFDTSEPVRASVAVAVLDSLLEGCQVIDFDGRYVFVNEAVVRQGRRPREAYVGRTMEECYPGIEATPMFATLRRCLTERVHAQMENEFTFPDGTRGWFELRFVPVPLGACVLSLDVTGRKNAEAARRLSDERYRRIVEGTSEGVWMYDAEGRTTFVNARMAELLGCSVEEAVGQSIFAFIHDTGHEQAQARIARRLRGVAERVEARLRRADGREVWITSQTNPLFDSEGRVDGVLALVTDVTAERGAAEMRGRIAAIVEASDDAIYGTDTRGVVTAWNHGAERLYGYTVDEMIGRAVATLAPPEREVEMAELLVRAVDGAAVPSTATTRVRKDGTPVEVALSVAPIRDAAGVVIGTSRIARDLTAERAAEAALRRTDEQLRQAQKMEAVGRLAGAVAHDFNNILSVILSLSTLLLEDMSGDHAMRADLDEIRRAGERAAALTRQLLTFSRHQPLAPVALDLGHVVAGLEKLLGHLLGEDIELTRLQRPSRGTVLADAGQIEQVVINLAVNARDAMPHGGHLIVETSDVELDAAYAALHVGVAPGPYVLLAVSDTGVGMDAATQARIFEPFFTTKPRGKGTGLGLATVYGIVHQSGGHLWVYSEPGQGTVFKLYFPRVVDTAAAAAPPRPAPDAGQGRETILLVEDDPQVRAVARSILRRGGYTVLEAPGPGEALLVCEQHGARIHLLLTDVIMPRMNGPQLAQRVRDVRPGIRVLFMSGYTDDAILHHGVLDGDVPFVQKPLTPENLARKVRDALDRTP